MNQELGSLSRWLNVNRLALNVSKTNFVIFRSKRKALNHNVTLILNRKAIEQKDHVKYLGVLVDQHLTWKHQVSGVASKISRCVGILAKLRNSVNFDILVNIYYCLVYSHLFYGVQAWGSACRTETEKLLHVYFFIRNRFIRNQGSDNEIFYRKSFLISFFLCKF